MANVDAGSDVSKFDAGVINLAGLSSGAHTLYVELVDNSGDPLSTPVNATVNFTVNNIIQTLPFFEPFDYTATENLGDQTIWQNQFSGDEIVVGSGNLSYTGMAPSSGNHVMFDGAGIDPRVDFTNVTSGVVYVSFIFSVTDQSAIDDSMGADGEDGGYFAVLGNFDARLWVRRNPTGSLTDFDIGAGAASNNNTTTDPTTYNVGDDIFVVMSYDIDNDVVNAWINPTTMELNSSTPPTPTLTEADTGDVTNINQFVLRQDTAGETPSILFDELRIGTSWNDVTPATLSNEDFADNLFKVYPNPTNLGYVNISSRSASAMQISVYDVLGKQAINTTISNNRLDVSSLNTGVYIMKVTQDEATTTKKLVIK